MQFLLNCFSFGILLFIFLKSLNKPWVLDYINIFSKIKNTQHKKHFFDLKKTSTILQINNH